MTHISRSGPTGHRDRAALRAAVAGLLGLTVVTGCSAQPAAPPSTPPAPPAVTTAPAPPTYSPQLCSAATQFQTAANVLVQLDATKVGTEGVKAALQDLADAGRNLAAAAGTQFGPQVDALQQALASLQATVAGIGDQASLSAKLGALAASVGQVEAAAKPIVDSVRTGCTGVPPVQLPPTS
jgi:hypothetical protein